MAYDNFNKILELVYAKSPLQKKKIKRSLLAKDKSFFSSAEEFSVNYMNYLQSEQIPVEYAVDAYLKMCSSMLKSQISFMKTESENGLSLFPSHSCQPAFITNVSWRRSKMEA